MFELNEIVISNMISSLCLCLARERGLKSKHAELIAGGYHIGMGSDRESEF